MEQPKQQLTEEQREEVLKFLESETFKKYVKAELNHLNKLFKPNIRYKSNPISRLKEAGLWDTDEMYKNIIIIYRNNVFGDKDAKIELSSTLRQALSEICSAAIDNYLKDQKQ